MATRKIIAYFMHETERNAALGLLQNHTSTDSFVMGEMDETAIPQLQNQGLIVEEIKAAPPLTSAATQSNLHGVIRAQALASFVPDPGVVPEIDFNKPQFYLVWLAGPLLEQWKQELTSAGAEILEALPTGAYKIRLLPSAAPQIQQKPYVTQLHLIEPRETSVEFITPQPAPQLPVPGAPLGTFLAAPQVAVAPKTAPLAMHTFDVRLHRAQDASLVLNWLAQKQVSVAGASGQKIRVYLLEGAPEINALALLPEVESMEEYVQPRLHNDVARRLLNIDSPHPDAVGLSGNNQIVGVADTGIDDLHPDFAGQIVGKAAWGRPNDTTDPLGHGTHVAGSIAGNGNASQGHIRGTAPGAKLFCQSLLDAQGGLGGLPLNLGDLFAQAYQAGARIHNNS